MTSLKTQLETIKGVNPYVDVDFVMNTLKKYPEGMFIIPNDATDYAMFDTLHNEYHIFAKQSFPIWSKGLFRGNRVFYKYALDLNQL